MFFYYLVNYTPHPKQYIYILFISVRFPLSYSSDIFTNTVTTEIKPTQTYDDPQRDLFAPPSHGGLKIVGKHQKIYPFKEFMMPTG